jgi:DNA-binding IclR family transcriptional regulator
MEAFTHNPSAVNQSGRTPRQQVSGTAAIEKAFDVLDAIAGAPSPPNLKELGRTTGLPRSTLHRIVSLLAARGHIRLDASGTRYVPGLHLLEIARFAWERLDVRVEASTVLTSLAKELGETVHLASLLESQIVYLDKFECDQPIRLHSAVGKRGPVHCTALGKAITAFLPPRARDELLDHLDFPVFTERTVADRRQMQREWEGIRRRQVAFDWEEHAIGVHCLGAAIFDYRGQPVAGLSVTAPTFRVDAARLEGFAPSVLAAAQAITRAMGGAYPAPDFT